MNLSISELNDLVFCIGSKLKEENVYGRDRLETLYDRVYGELEDRVNELEKARIQQHYNESFPQ